ncbi:MAG: hypothetical protein ACI31M_00620 [Bacilli bacterium]
MKCFRSTSINTIERVYIEGIIPSCGRNSRLIGDNRKKVFFSEGFHGTIALLIDFNIVYNKIKKNQMQLSDRELYSRVINSKNIREYLGEGVYLTFDSENIVNENNEVDGFTSEKINSDLLEVALIVNINDGTFSYSRFDVVHFMMSQVNPDDIKYSGIKWPNNELYEKHNKKSEEEKIRINQSKIKQYYEENQDLINKFRTNKYRLLYIPLKKFISRIYISKEKTEMFQKALTKRKV